MTAALSPDLATPAPQPVRCVRLELVPMSLRAANAFVTEHHRHHRAVRGCKFAIGAAVAGQLVGVALVGRPVSRVLDDGTTLEVNRCCTDGTPNACSYLYGAAWRATRALGYRRLVTYTLVTEPGTSLRAAAWRVVGETTARSWSCPSRPRAHNERQAKLRWEPA